MRPSKTIVYKLTFGNQTKEYHSKRLLQMALQNEKLLETGYEISLIHNTPPFINIHKGDVFIDTKSFQPQVVGGKKKEVVGNTLIFYVAFGDTNEDVKKYCISSNVSEGTLEITVELKPTLWEGVLKVKPSHPDGDISSQDKLIKAINSFVNLYLF